MPFHTKYREDAPVFLPNVEAGESVLIGHSNTLDPEININYTFKNGEKSVNCPIS